MEQKAYLLSCAAQGRADDFSLLLRGYVLDRLGLPESVRETDLYELCVLSIKLRLHSLDAAAAEDLEERLKKYDCHQTEAAVQKKVLLLMHVERLLAVPPAHGGSIRTMEELSRYLYENVRKEIGS